MNPCPLGPEMARFRAERVGRPQRAAYRLVAGLALLTLAGTALAGGASRAETLRWGALPDIPPAPGQTRPG